MTHAPNQSIELRPHLAADSASGRMRVAVGCRKPTVPYVLVLLHQLSPTQYQEESKSVFVYRTRRNPCIGTPAVGNCVARTRSSRTSSMRSPSIGDK